MPASYQPSKKIVPSLEKIPWWVTSVVILAALLNAAGAVVAQADPSLLIASTDRMSGAANVYAGYLTSRNLALAIALLALLAVRSRRMLTGALVLAALIQAIDVAVDASTGRLSLVPGLVILTILLGAAAAKLSPQPLWRASTWRDTPAQPVLPPPGP